MSEKKYLIVIGGPTASGKTGFAIQLANEFNTVILSCDSRQFYKEMNIGTAKPSPEELRQAKHYFINSHSIEQAYSVGDFEQEGIELLNQLFQKYSIIVMTGGSGLYINAICQGLDHFPKVPIAIREELEKEYELKGLSYLQEQLKTHDPKYYAEVDLQNPHRLIRALSICKVSGQAFSAFRKKETIQRIFTPIYIQMNWPRALLYQRINLRVDQMIEQGLLEEVKSLQAKQELSALQTVGYQELFDYLEGKSNLEEAIELIKRNSRRYAKRQLTWMRRDQFWKRFHPQEKEACLNYIHLVMKEETSVKTGTVKDWKNLTGQALELPDYVQLVMAFKDDKPNAGLLLVQRKDYFIIEELVERADVPTISMLIHEAITRAADTPLFVLCRWAKMALFKQFDFESIQVADAPESLQKRYGEELSESMQTILMQKF